MSFPNPFKPDASIYLQSAGSALPGSVFNIRVRLTPQEEIKSREVRVELEGWETYYIKQTSSNGKSTTTRIVKRSAVFSQIVRSLAQEPVLMKGIEQYWDSSLEVPPDAPPSSKGKLVDIRWKLKSVIDVAMRQDESTELPFQIYKLPPQFSGDPSFTPAEKTFDSCHLRLEAPRTAGCGDTLIGHLRIDTKKSFNVRGIRIDLIQSEDAGARKSDVIAVTQQVSGPVSLNPHEFRAFDFSLAVPLDASPSAVAPHSSLRWIIKASLDRQLRKDFNVEQELLLYNAPGK